MPFAASTYAWDPLALAYFVGALVVATAGGGVLLYERFTQASRHLYVVATVTAGWVTTLGMAVLAADPATEAWWLRATFAIDPFTVPALYGLALVLAGARRANGWLVWVPAAPFAVISLTTPWLVDGLQSLTRGYTLADGGWLGAIYFGYILAVCSLSALELVRSQDWAVTREEQREGALLSAALMLAMLTLLDYWLPTETFRAGPLTPIALGGAAVIAVFVAARYRIFSIARSFGTDEVMRAMPDAVLVCDGVGRIRGVNRRTEQLLDAPEEKLIGLHVSRYLHEAGAANGERWVPPTTAGPEREMRLRMPGGEEMVVSVTTEPLLSRDRSVGAVVVVRDIRERIHAERALRAAERRYTSLFWHNPGSSYEFDREGRFVAANPAAEELLGVSAEDLRDMPFAEIIHPDDRQEAAAVFAAVLAGGAREYELRVITAHGDTRRIRGVSSPIFDGGEVVGVFGVALDVTEAARVKQQLEVQRRYFADLFEGSPEGVVLVEAETDRVLRINAEFTRMFGWTSEEAVGRDLNDLIVPEEVRWEGAELNRAAREGGRLRTETVRQHRDGRRIDVSVLARELRIPGEPVQLYGVYRDIGDRKETERALRQREEELRHAQKLEAVGKLAGGIAHDFNNLVTVINGHARFALEQADPGGELEADLLEIEKAGGRAAELTQQLLAYSRRQVLHPQALDPNVVILELQGMLRRLIGEHIEVETLLTDEDVRVRADRGQLEQVLVNLVVNAQDAMPEGGTLTLSADIVDLDARDARLEGWGVSPGRFVRLRVTDTGTGMDAETLDRAFEPFFTTKEQGKGTGLGLSTAFGIIKQSGGHMSAESRPGEGTRFDVILPASDVGVEAAVEPDRAGAEDCQGMTVLVAEDEAAVRQLVVRVLERSGCTVLAAENGARAMEIARDHDGPLDLVLTDLVMPDMGGHELADRLRRRAPELPILFMSGYDEDLIAEVDSDAPFLAKPFSPADLVQRVSDAARSGRAPRA